MRGPGMPPSRMKPLGPDRADSSGQPTGLKGVGLLLVALGVVFAELARSQVLSAPLTDTPGDPAQGEAIVNDPQHGLCTLCHSGPFPQVAFSGNLGPDLTGIGARRVGQGRRRCRRRRGEHGSYCQCLTQPEIPAIESNYTVISRYVHDFYTLNIFTQHYMILHAHYMPLF